MFAFISNVVSNLLTQHMAKNFFFVIQQQPKLFLINVSYFLFSMRIQPAWLFSDHIIL